MKHREIILPVEMAANHAKTILAAFKHTKIDKVVCKRLVETFYELTDVGENPISVIVYLCCRRHCLTFKINVLMNDSLFK